MGAKGKQYGSQRGFAGALGVSAGTVGGWVQRDDWPVSRRGPWSEADLVAVRQWRAWLQEDRSGKGAEPGLGGGGGEGGGANAKQKAETLLKVHRARRAKVEADLAEGRVVDRALLDAAMIALTRLFVQCGSDTFERLPHQLRGDQGINEGICQQAWAELRERIISSGELELGRADDQISGRMGGAGRGRPSTK